MEKVVNYFNNVKQLHRNQIENVKLNATNLTTAWLSKKTLEITRAMDQEIKGLVISFIDFRDRQIRRNDLMRGVEDILVY